MTRWPLAALVVAGACRAEPAIDAPGESREPSTASRAAASAGAPTAATQPASPDGPGLVVINQASAAIDIYGAYLVDRRGELGTRALWPHRFDCPEVPAPARLLPSEGTLVLPPPTEAYEPGSCTPTPLPAGDYLLRLDSGYGEELYAAAAITLPLVAPVELEMRAHETPACDPERARRAAVLAFAAAEAEGLLPAGLRQECDPLQARCGSTVVEESLPPATCTITLHDRFLRVDRAAADDASRGLTAWADHEVVYVRQPHLTRSSASRAEVEGKPVVIAGVTSQHRHEHGGEAATIGHVRFLAHNPLARPLKLRVLGIEFLGDSQCQPPSEVRARPRLAEVSLTELPVGASQIAVGFAAQGAYQVHCDRFATRVSFEVAGQRIAATAEHEVTRYEPLRERP